MAATADDIKLQSLTEGDWKRLIEKIKVGHCTPIIGPGAYSQGFPWDPTVAMGWMQAYTDADYPYPWDSYELARVAQYLSVVADPSVPKDAVAAQIKALEPPNFNEPDEPHRVLASLPLPIYITTNYDSFMMQALEHRRERDKKPIREFCRWGPWLRQTDAGKALNPQNLNPTVANPVVYHLHGHDDVPDSLVLTYDDYLDFLVNIAEDNSLIDDRIERALTGTSLLLLGYQLEDWNFRALFRSIVMFLQRGLKKINVAVQLDPSFGDQPTLEQTRRAQKYFNRYFETKNVKVYWGSCHEFVAELRIRLNPPLFKPVDINWPLLCSRLVKAASEQVPNPSKRIVELLPPDLWKIISDAGQANNFQLTEPGGLVPAFNDILKRRDFYESEVFAGVTITSEAKTFLKRKVELSDIEVQKLNRLLFEALYPDEIKKNNEWEAF